MPTPVFIERKHLRKIFNCLSYETEFHCIVQAVLKLLAVPLPPPPSVRILCVSDLTQLLNEYFSMWFVPWYSLSHLLNWYYCVSDTDLDLQPVKEEQMPGHPHKAPTSNISIIVKWIFRKSIDEVREMSQWLRELNALAQSTSSISNTNMALTNVCNCSSRGSDASSDLHRLLHAHGTYIYIPAKTHTH